MTRRVRLGRWRRGHHAAQAGAAEGAPPRPRPRPPPRPRPRRRRRPRPRRRRLRRPDVLEAALEHLVRGIVEHPDDVRVDLVTSRRGKRLEVRVHPDDLGKVIGRSGRTAKALRTGRRRHRRPGRPRRRRRHRRADPQPMDARRRADRQPHGVRGEVTVERTHRRPGRAVRDRVVAAHRPGRARAAHGDRRAPRAPAGWSLAFEGVGRPDGGRGAARHRAGGRLGRAAGDEDADEFYDHQLVGLAAVDPAGAALGDGRRRRARARRRTCSWSGDRTAASMLVPFVAEIVPAVDVPGGRRRRRPAGRGCSTL